MPPRFTYRLLCLLAVLPGAGAPALADEDITYRLQVTGAPTGSLDERVADASDLKRLQDRPVASPALLRRRAEEDLPAMREVLRSQGYYAAEVVFELQEPAEPGEPWTVSVAVDPGEPFVLRRFEIVLADALEISGFAPTYTELGIAPGDRLEAAKVVEATNRVLGRLGEIGHPRAEVISRDVVVDHAGNDVLVRLEIRAGPQMRFGDIAVTGLERVEVPAVLRNVEWQQGTRFDTRTVNATRRALQSTGLFSSISIRPGTVGENGLTPIEIDVREAPRRSIGGGLRYSTDLGAGATAFWETRNLLGEGENLRADVTVAERAQAAALLFRVPAFLHRNQTLSLSTSLAHEEQEAFESDTFAAGAAVERVLGRYLTGSAGISFERSFITDADGEDDFVLFGFPLDLAWDSTGNALDPTAGVRAHLGVTPYTDFAAEAQQFGIVDGQASLYLGLDEADRWVVALRAGAGAAVGEPRSGIPPDKRFYAGGGDSVRGYGYQLVGPLEDDSTPLGGASILTAGIELRARIFEQVGGVVFLDAGNVYEDNVPTGGGDLLFGAGVGLRYYTPIGPLRLDVAVPLDRRPVDDAFQLYISLGQAF